MPDATLLERTIAFQGKVFDVARDRVVLPHGHTTALDVVLHRGSVVLVAMPDAERVMLVRQYRHAVGRWLWELPAGTREAGEDAEAGARRECQEELGLVPGRVERLGALFPTPGYCTEEMVYYRLTELREPAAGDPEAHQDADEHLEPRAFTLAEVRAMIARGEVADLKTVGGLALI